MNSMLIHCIIALLAFSVLKGFFFVCPPRLYSLFIAPHLTFFPSAFILRSHLLRTMMYVMQQYTKTQEVFTHVLQYARQSGWWERLAPTTSNIMTLALTLTFSLFDPTQCGSVLRITPYLTFIVLLLPLYCHIITSSVIGSGFFIV